MRVHTPEETISVNFFVHFYSKSLVEVTVISFLSDSNSCGVVLQVKPMVRLKLRFCSCR